MSIKAVILDIEGTVAPITFVKDELFPFFLNNFKSYIKDLSYPLSSTSSSDGLVSILSNFPAETLETYESLSSYIEDLVSKDIKDSTLKSFQGIVWAKGYESGAVKAPVYKDFIENLNVWKSKGLKVYIYSSGSVNAQKLLFKYVKDEAHPDVSFDINPKLDGYFDITTSGFKQEKSSYLNILKDIGLKGEEVIFFSDNYLEIKASTEAKINGVLVIRPGNAPLTQEIKSLYKTIHSFNEIEI